MIAYYNGEYLPKENININPDDRGFLLADGLYEVVRYYRGKPFKLDQHRQRLESGARALRFNRHDFDDFTEVVNVITEKNDLLKANSSIVYFQFTRGAAPRSHSFPSNDVPLTAYAFAREFHSHVDEQKNGANAITLTDDRWSNCQIKSIALLPNTLAHQKARDNGAIEGFFIRDGKLQEGTHSNIMVVLEGKVVTPPLSNFILPGITRKTVLDLCSQLSLPFEERDVKREEIFNAEEVFVVGTTLEITPIVRVDDHEVGKGKPGVITGQLQGAFEDQVPGSFT